MLNFNEFLENEDILTEGIHDKGIFKAFYLAGGPGSGKSWVAAKTLEGSGLKVVNSDIGFAWIKKKHHLSVVIQNILWFQKQKYSNNIVKNKVNSKNIHFFFVPVDKNIESFEVYKMKPKNDLFYAMSHGVNRATLKKGVEDERINFLDKLVKKIPDIKYDFYGFANKQPIWGNDFNNALINSKMGLNLSRGKPTKYYSSNRIASIMGNGLLTFIDEKVQMNDFFNKNEIVFYKNINDLEEKIKFYSKNDQIRIKIARNGKKKYFKLFNETKISKYFIDISLGNKASLF